MRMSRLAGARGARPKAVRGHAGLVLFAALLVVATLGAGAVYGLACAALRISLWAGAAAAAALLAAFLGFNVWETLRQAHVPPLTEVFGGALTTFVVATIVFLPTYLIAHYWLARRRRRDA